MTMKALVTGGTGFIGANLARTLIQNKHDVALLIRKESKKWRIKDILHQITLLDSDLSDLDNLHGAINGYNPDVIFHLAVYGSYPRTEKDVDLMIKTNIVGTSNLFEIAGSTPVINAGSSSEYGIMDMAMREDNLCQPDNFYGWSKLTQTLYSQVKRAVTLRIFHAYGPWEEPTRLLPHLIKSRIAGSSVQLISSVRDFIYIEDVLVAFFRAAEKFEKLKGQVINIGSGRQTSVKQILEMLDRIDPIKLDVTWDFPAVQTEPKKWCADIHKAKAVLGWTPQYDLKRGLKETYNWWREYFG